MCWFDFFGGGKGRLLIGCMGQQLWPAVTGVVFMFAIQCVRLSKAQHLELLEMSAVVIKECVCSVLKLCWFSCVVAGCLEGKVIYEEKVQQYFIQSRLFTKPSTKCVLVSG